MKDLENIKEEIKRNIKNGKAIEPLLRDLVNSIICEKHNVQAKYISITNNEILFDSCCNELKIQVQETVRNIVVNVSYK